MRPAEFEERSYEGPLYNQLERGNLQLWTPGQVLENKVGFDRGLFLAEQAVWQILDIGRVPRGAALALYRWPHGWGPADPRRQLPDFRLNLFLQAKRSNYAVRTPRAARAGGMSGPCFAFFIDGLQQKRLEQLAATLGQRAHVAYAAPAFHRNHELFAHTRHRSIVPNSTFPSAAALSNHDAWYYQDPGAVGVANPNPTLIDEPSLEERIASLAEALEGPGRGDLHALDELSSSIGAAVERFDDAEGLGARYFDDVQTLERMLEPYQVPPTITAYARVNIFSAIYSLSWLVVGHTKTV